MNIFVSNTNLYQTKNMIQSKYRYLQIIPTYRPTDHLLATAKTLLPFLMAKLELNKRRLSDHQMLGPIFGTLHSRIFLYPMTMGQASQSQNRNPYNK